LEQIYSGRGIGVIERDRDHRAPRFLIDTDFALYQRSEIGGVWGMPWVNRCAHQSSDCRRRCQEAAFWLFPTRRFRIPLGAEQAVHQSLVRAERVGHLL